MTEVMPSAAAVHLVPLVEPASAARLTSSVRPCVEQPDELMHLARNPCARAFPMCLQVVGSRERDVTHRSEAAWENN